MLCSEEEIKVYERVNNYIKDGKVLPYEKELIDKLNSNTDIKNKNFNSYLEGLCSAYNASNTYLFTRYLMLFLDPKKYSVVYGALKNIGYTRPSYYWIESDTEVYDVGFIGKWNKDDFYDVFNPKVYGVLDLENDLEFNLFKKNNIKVENKENNLKYLDWYSYMKNNSVKRYGFREYFKYYDFPNSKDSEMKLIKKQ